MTLFDYKTDISQLSGNGGISQSKLVEIGTTNEQTGTKFFSSDSTFKWQVSSADTWIPSQHRRKQGSVQVSDPACKN